MEITNLSAKDTSIHRPFPNMPTVPFNMIMVGASFSGKSNLCRNMVKKYKRFFQTRILYITGSCNGTVEKMKAVDGVRVCTSMYPGIERPTTRDKSIVQEVLDVQKSVPDHERQHVLIVLDDCTHMYGMDAHRGPIVELFANARNYNISVIFTAQSYTKIPTIGRDNAMFRIYFKVNQRVKKQIVDDLITPYMSDTDTITNLYNECTNQPYSFLYYDFLEGRFYKKFASKPIACHPWDAKYDAKSMSRWIDRDFNVGKQQDTTTNHE